MNRRNADAARASECVPGVIFLTPAAIEDLVDLLRQHLELAYAYRATWIQPVEIAGHNGIYRTFRPGPVRYLSIDLMMDRNAQ